MAISRLRSPLPSTDELCGSLAAGTRAARTLTFYRRRRLQCTAFGEHQAVFEVRDTPRLGSRVF